MSRQAATCGWSLSMLQNYQQGFKWIMSSLVLLFFNHPDCISTVTSSKSYPNSGCLWHFPAALSSGHPPSVPDIVSSVLSLFRYFELLFPLTGHLPNLYYLNSAKTHWKQGQHFILFFIAHKCRDLSCTSLVFIPKLVLRQRKCTVNILPTDIM